MQTQALTDVGPTADRLGSPRWERVLLVVLVITTAALLGVAIPAGMPAAHGDAVGYLVNVTVRPGYGFANADAALAYGNGICDGVSRGRSYDDLVEQVKSDFSTRDDYQASYLISQAVDELCPALIWQLRNSAAHHRPSP